MRSPTELLRRDAVLRARWLRAATTCGLLLGLAAGPARAQVTTMPQAAPGRVESGAPSFVVIGPEGMGLSAPPTEIRRLPDGRVLAVSQRQLAFGDGVRWETYNLAPEIPGSGVRSVLVDTDGRLYAGTGPTFSRIRFDADSHWRVEQVAELPALAGSANPAAATNAYHAGDGWFWHSSSGSVIKWKPGLAPTIIGSTNAADSIFTCSQQVYVSDRADGTLLRLENGALTPVFPPERITPRHAISNSAPFDSTHSLVGTHALGLMLFDGHTLEPFATAGVLANGQRVNDVCALPGGFFAAALDKTGIAFFDRQGHVVQLLSQSVDHRLARPQQFLTGTDGVLWVLLNEGVARIEFPSRISHLDPLISTGVTIAMPFRYAGDLWLLADGRIQRGLYDDDGRLDHFLDETPDAGFVFAFSFADERLILGGSKGILVRDGSHWRTVVPDIVNARIMPMPPRDRRWLYCARGEFGWLTIDGDHYSAERRPIPGLGDNYGARLDGEGVLWLELGAGAIGRIDTGAVLPGLELFGAAAGVPNSWAQVFVLDGVARFNVGNTIRRFDAATRRFVVDTAFSQRYAVTSLDGRPGRDQQGRLWMSIDGEVRVLDDSGPTVRVLDERILHGLRPYYCTFEQGGVVWLHENRRLARYDPAMPQLTEAPLRALITDVLLSATNRRLYPAAGPLPPLDHVDNSLVAHFMAPANPFRQLVTFEVMLEGAGQEWVSTGNVGSAVFSRLKEGDYVLRVRPRAGATLGQEARLAFTVLAPWYRTSLAYSLYALSVLATVGGIAWLASYIQRLEKSRLEKIVTVRTTELHETNLRLRGQIEETLRTAAELRASDERAHQLNATLTQQIEATLRKAVELQTSEDRYRKLSAELEHRVEQRTAELNQANDRLQSSNQELEAFSYSVSHDLRAPLRNISGFADLLRRRSAGRLDVEGEHFLTTVSKEAIRLGQLIDSLLGFSRLGRAELQRRPLLLQSIAEQVRSELRPELEGRAVEWRLAELPEVSGDPTLLRQVLANLIGNALKFSRQRQPAVIELGQLPPKADHPGEAVFFIRDNGVGFDPAYTAKLFGVFQRLHSAKDYEGTGIGLANVRRIISRHGGRVWAESVPGEGATFYFTLPLGL